MTLTYTDEIKILNDFLDELFEKNDLQQVESRKSIFAQAISARNLYLFKEINHRLVQESDETYELAFYSRAIYQFFCSKDKNISELKLSLIDYKKATYFDKIYTSLQKNPITLKDFNVKIINEIASNEQNLVYLDENVFSSVLDDKRDNTNKAEQNLANLLSKCIQNNLVIVYSPNHLEEIVKLSKQEDKVLVMKNIIYLTNNYCLLPTSLGYCFAQEELIYPLNRVEKSLEVSELLEQHDLLFQQKRGICYPEHDNIKHRTVINNENDVFDSISEEKFNELSIQAGSQLTKAELSNCKFNDRDELIHKVKTLYNILELLGFKVEKKNNSNKTGFVYDSEHLCYASQCKFFIVNDNRLKSRAQQIYKFMGFETQVLLLDEFLAMKL